MRSFQVIQLLKSNGWELVRHKGSCMQFKKGNNPFLASVHVHKGKDISKFVLEKLRKGTGIEELR